MLSKPSYLYDRKVPVLFVFRGGLCVMGWLVSVTFLKGTGAEASLMAFMSVNSAGAILFSVELAKGEAMGLDSIVSKLLNGVAPTVLWAEPLLLKVTGAVVSWK